MGVKVRHQCPPPPDSTNLDELVVFDIHLNLELGGLLLQRLVPTGSECPEPGFFGLGVLLDLEYIVKSWTSS